MRYLVSILLAAVMTLTAVAQTDSLSTAATPSVEVDNKTLWQSANQAYIDGDYTAAINYYSTIERRGNYSAKLYYNLGNSHFKQGNLGKSILYYNRALKVAPSMDDAQYNLQIAEALTKDKIAIVPEFFLNRWIRTLQGVMSCNGWSVLSIVLFVAMAACALLFLLGTRLSARKSGFYGVIISLLLFIVTTAFAISSRNDILDRNSAIVISSAISVKSSPDRAATDLFVLHEGTKVTISSVVEGWCEITIADGKKGWTEELHLERI